MTRSLSRIFPLRAALALVLLSGGASRSVAQNDSGGGPALVERWTFDDGAEPGPRLPSYPAFPPSNLAVSADGGKAVRVVSGKEPRLRFGAGDEITLEAWAKVRSLGEGQHVYLIGKGRTKGRPNQNYALRLKGEGGQAKLNFLFSSAPGADGKSGWHRWTGSASFSLTGWHHLAVTYRFGDPGSIRGYVDGKPVRGTWDMDGATDRAPVTDEDDVWIGAGNGGGTGNGFDGWIDDVAVWRGIVPEEEMAARYQHVPPPPAVTRGEVPAGEVLVQIAEEGVPAKAASWPEEPPKVTEQYRERAFGFFEEPIRYVGTGVRGDRANPHLFRAAAVVRLPAGKHRLLLRARGGSRLLVDGVPVLTTPFNNTAGSGHGRVATQREYLDLGPDFRFAPPGNRESWTEFVSPGGEHFVIVETLVGGAIGKSARRPELGETVVAWSPQGETSWRLLSPRDEVIPYTDPGWAAYEAERRAHLDEVNAASRARLRAAHAGYWERRRAVAREWLAATPEISPPPLPAGYPARNAVDHFLADRIARATAERGAVRPGDVDFFREVRPILEANCFQCHQGGKAKGGLRLDDRAEAFRGGKSDGPAVAPGHPERSSLVARITTDDPDAFMPPKGKPLSPAQVDLLRTWIAQGARWPETRTDHLALTPLADDLTFLRRVFLDTVGVPPTLDEIAAFEANPDRAAWIDRLLDDPRAADHGMGYWLDVLAENPNILNPTLNNSGPFRWWIHESLRDHKPMDLFVTELLRMEGSERFGGPAGFAVASQNDVPMAEKGVIVASAFLGVEMKCARCHDAPAHRSSQEDLFRLAAMLKRETLEVPKTSSVPMDRFHGLGRAPLIQVTLRPGAKVAPAWPFAEFCEESVARDLAEDPGNPRDVLAALITAPQNERFAQVMANRLWARYMGRGLVPDVADWEKERASHPELLAWLGREFVRGGYDLRPVARLILNSHAYQRAVDPALAETPALFTAPAARPLQAEQIVDSLFAATGKPFRTEEASLDIDGSRDLGNSISLGQPRRAWMLTSTSNERDRPSLALPRIQAVVDVLEAFGWRGARQNPVSVRETGANIIQPAILSNGTMGKWLTVLSDDHGVTDLALAAASPEDLVDRLYLRLLTRRPAPGERAAHAAHLAEGFAGRVRPSPPPAAPSGRRERPLYVSWSNHLDPEATVLRQQEELRAREGDPPTCRLEPAWRERLEDVLWSLLNAPEWNFTP
jgi:mono/diheme cytochrome c family protein